MNAGNGNLSITYDGLFSGVAMNGTQFGNNSSVQCVGGLTTSKGKLLCMYGSFLSKAVRNTYFFSNSTSVNVII